MEYKEVHSIEEANQLGLERWAIVAVYWSGSVVYVMGRPV